MNATGTTVAGHKAGLRRKSLQTRQRSVSFAERDRYMRLIQECLRSGGNPVTDIDEPFRPVAEMWHNAS
jgi:hypothetical protein